MLHLVGRGEVQLQLPPGSISIPLKKAPSGHLVMVIDDYDKVPDRRGGVEDASLQLHTDEPRESTSSSSGEPLPHDRGDSQIRTPGGAHPVVQGELCRGDASASQGAQREAASKSKAKAVRFAAPASPRNFSI